MKLVIKNVRLSFPDLFEPGEYEGTKSYGATFLVAPGSVTDKAIRAAMQEVAVEKWKDKGAAILKAAMAGGNQKCSYFDGNTKTYDGYADMYALTAKRGAGKGRPGVYNKDRTPLVAEDGVVYAGCYANASVEFWAQDNKFGKTVRATLVSVQFAGEGDAFTNMSKPDENDFDVVEEDDGEELV